MTISELVRFDGALKRARQREDSHNAQTLYFPAQYERDLAIASAESANETIDILRICATERSDPESFQLALWRDLAETGIKVRAIYLLSHLGLVVPYNKSMELDDAAGIEVGVLAAKMLPDALVRRALSSFALIDSRTSVQAPAGLEGAQSGFWTVSASLEIAAMLEHTFSDLWAIRRKPDALDQDLDLEEPLVQSASLIASLAPVLCNGDHVSESGCDWYHGSWQLFRLMDLVSTPTWHHDFYSGSLRHAVEAGARHFLITGTADYSVFAYVAQALSSVGDEASVTVVDLCGTPLFACRWYGKRVGLEPTVVAQDILRFLASSTSTFDVIVTDAFLTRFEGSSVRRVLEGWKSGLVAGGKIITTVRCHAARDAAQDEEDAILGFRARAKSTWERWSPFVDISASEVAERAELYARRMVTNPIGTREEILSLIGEYFEVESQELGPVPGELHPTSYLRLVLQR